jgi:UDP-2-acetamido-2,6-beta-L-arabino-hexul-4-ose reductase
MKIAITGEKGFLGNHLTKFFKNETKFETVSLGRNYLDDLHKLKNVDYLIHAASVHRDPNPEAVYLNNMLIHKQLISFLVNNSIKTNIVFISSIQEIQNNPYGRSKSEGKILFKKFCEEAGTEFFSYPLPNLFGSGAKPYRTSFVATFCYNLHNDIQCQYNSNIVNLCFIDNAVKEIGKFRSEPKFDITTISVSEIFDILFNFNKLHLQNKTPIINSDFEENLFTTFLSYKDYIIKT